MKIRDILKETGYAVVLKQGEGGLSATFPEKKLGFNSPILSNKRFYAPIYDDISGIDFYSNSINPPNTFIKCPAYAIRLVVASDILSVCNYYAYSPKLIVTLDKDDNDISSSSPLKISMLLKEANSPEHIELESKLRDIVQKAVPNKFNKKYSEMAKKFDVVEGYDFVKRIIQGEMR